MMYIVTISEVKQARHANTYLYKYNEEMSIETNKSCSWDIQVQCTYMYM